MLSYRHAFHAGNHADVLKHWIYSLVLDYFNQKDKPYWVVDTHAGAGAYLLSEAMANKTAEHLAGIAKLQQSPDVPAIFSPYLQALQAYQNQAASLYPGSPAVAAHFLRTDDKLRLFELHPADYATLSTNVAQQFSKPQRQINVQLKDGFEGMKACLPPPTKRGMVLIDPPYELKEDYARVVAAVKEGLKRFSTGTYLVWYPLLQRPEPQHMLNQLRGLQTEYLHIALQVHAPREDGFGMYGSGMWIINPPWTLQAAITSHLNWLAQTLGQDETAHAWCESQSR